MNYVKCSYCNCEYKVDTDFLGKSIKCQECHNFFEVIDIYEKKRKPTFEELAVAYNLVTKEQLDEARSIQQAEEQLGRDTPISEIFIQKNMMSLEQLTMIQDINKYMELRLLDKQFGKIAIKKGFLSEREIKLALSVQAISFKKNKYCRLIGDILIESGVMNDSQRDIILEEQKRIDISLPRKKSSVVNAETNADLRTRIRDTLHDIRSMSFKEFILTFTQKRALVVISVIILLTAGLMMYASTIKPKNYRQIGKEGVIDKIFKPKKYYKYPFEFSTTLKDSAFLRLEMDVEFYDLNGFEEFDNKLPRIKHAFGLVFNPRFSYQIRSRKKIVRTLKKIFNSQLDVHISNVYVTEYILTKPSGGNIKEPERSLPDFSFN